MASKPRRTEKRPSGTISSTQVMFAMILGLGLLLAINFSSRITESQPLLDTHQRILNEIAALEAEQAALIAQRDYVRSDLYVERWARDSGKMVQAGEVLMVPVPSGINSEATPVVPNVDDIQTAPPTPEPWELWWALFFDSQPPGQR